MSTRFRLALVAAVGSMSDTQYSKLSSQIDGLRRRVRLLSVAVACQVAAVFFNIFLDVLYILLDVSGRWPMVVADVISGIVK